MNAPTNLNGPYACPERSFGADSAPVPLLTLVHVLISLVGIFSGLIVLRDFLGNQHRTGIVAVFLWSTLATSVTGFLFFPLKPFTGAHVFGILTLLILPPAMYGLYARALAGGWRRMYVIGSVVALYLNVFALVVQLFRRVPPLKTLAPTQTEPPFGMAQLAVLALFIFLGRRCVKRFQTTLKPNAP